MTFELYSDEKAINVLLYNQRLNNKTDCERKQVYSIK